jgi:hypothetical protein
VLAGVTLALYWPARHFDVILYDDPQFLFTTPGVSWASLRWAMTSTVAMNWHPATTFSFVLMHQFFGLNPGAEHLVNAAFHAANAALLFLLLLQLTGAAWRSAFVAAIFAWHPLRVESVAWISERKDVLFAFFMLLALMSYASYARCPRPVPWFRSPRYYLALGLFMISFLCKATVVTLPCLLLLLDVWPLQRLKKFTPVKLFIEKIPFFALALLFCIITFWIHKTSGDVSSLEKFSVATRTENALLSYVYYLGKFVYPSNLAILYPYPKSFDFLQVVFAALALLGISVLCVLQGTRRPWLAVGWFWYLIVLLPVIGFVQVGAQSMADRHTYISLIGPVVSLVWLFAEWAQTKWAQKILAAGSILMVAGCLALTEKQLPVWQNTATLFGHTLAVTPDNGAAQCPYATGLEQEGLTRQAAVRYRIGLSMPPGFNHYLDHYYLADLLWRIGKDHEAETNMQAAADLNPQFLEAVNGIAWMLAAAPEAADRDGAHAVQAGEQACARSDYQQVRYLGTLADAYAEAGRFDDAIAAAQKAISLAEENKQTSLAERNQQLLQIYQSHQAYHEPPADTQALK